MTQSASPTETSLAQLSELVQRATAATVHVVRDDVRNFLETVLQFHRSADASMHWLQSHVAALDGRTPLTMLNSGQLPELQRWWQGQSHAHDPRLTDDEDPAHA
jgi:small-conductance mechanosensitive channel